MGSIYSRRIVTFGLVLALSHFVAGQTVSLEELAARCEVMERAFVDVSLEYDWYSVPPLTREEADSKGILFTEDGHMHVKLSAANLGGPGGPGERQRWGLLMERQATYIDSEGNRLDSIVKESHCGETIKRFDVPDANGKGAEGFIGARDANKPPELWFMTPLNFSAICLANDADGVPLSARLRDIRIARLANEPVNINGWDTVRVDLLQEYTKQPCIAVYFSLQHNYAPVRYEYFNSGKAGTKLAYSAEVSSLDAVAEALWFPTSGIIQHPENTRADIFQVTSKVLINRGLTAKDIDIDFPPGTTVYHRINNKKYVVGK